VKRLGVVVAVLAAGLLVFAFLRPTDREVAPAAAPRTSTPSPAPSHISAQQMAGNMDVPATFTFDPDGRVFYGERFSGEIRIRDLTTDADRLFFKLPHTLNEGEQGLLGLAVHPDFPEVPYVYAYFTREVEGGAQNQIVRITSANDRGTDMRVLARIPSTPTHNGGILLFGPDGRLFAGSGDSGDANTAQDTSRLTGKVLRLTAHGSAAPGNPFGTPVYTYGHRNIFGIAVDPLTNAVWVTENGPECNDEINRLAAGGNYGWGPSGACGSPARPADTNRDGPARLAPAFTYASTIAPTGAVFCDGCGLGPAAEGTFLFGAFKDGIIRQLTLTADRRAIASSIPFYRHTSTSGVLSMARGPDGGIYFSDDNEIYRLVLR
jgi:glucose/arabinose dehydrogenase